MAGYVITLSTRGAAVLPFASKAEIVGALAADVVVAEMVVKDLWVGKGLGAVLPETSVRLAVAIGDGRGRGNGRRRQRRHDVRVRKIRQDGGQVCHFCSRRVQDLICHPSKAKGGTRLMSWQKVWLCRIRDAVTSHNIILAWSTPAPSYNHPHRPT